MNWAEAILFVFACIILYLDVFKWEWLSKLRYKKYVYDLINFKWGEKGIRITTGAIAVVVILSGIAVFLKRELYEAANPVSFLLGSLGV